MLGGIGFTWEHDAHLYLRRALALRQPARRQRAPGGPGRPASRSAARAGIGSSHRHLLPARTRAPTLMRSARQPGSSPTAVSAIAARSPAAQALAEIGYVAPAWPPPYGLGREPGRPARSSTRNWPSAGIERPDLGDRQLGDPGDRQPRHGRAARAGSPSRRCAATSPGASCSASRRPALTWRRCAPGRSGCRRREAGAGWRLTGQKVWTSLAAEADWAICLARTDPAAPKHKGITFFLVSMRRPGHRGAAAARDHRPRRCSTRSSSTTCFVPDDCVVGQPGDGWRIARTTLATERVAMVGGAGLGEDAEELLAAAAADGGVRDPVVIDQIGARLAESLALSVMDDRLARRRRARRGRSGQAAGQAAAVRKLLGVAHRQAVAETAVTLAGVQGAAADGRAAERRRQLPADQVPEHRGRHQPDPALPRGRTRARPAQGGSTLMNFEFDEAQQVIAASAADVLRGAEAGQDAGEAPGRRWPRPGCSRSRCPAGWAATISACSRPLCCSPRSGRQAADVPALATIMLGALPVVRWGDRDLQERVLAGVGDGETILTAGVREQSTVLPPVPATIATLDGAGSGTVTGTKIGVPYAAQARWILVPATVADRAARTGRGRRRRRSGTRCHRRADSGLRRNAGVHGPAGRRAHRRRPRG